MRINKVDDKPIVLHTKQKPVLHTHEPKIASVKGFNIYTVDRHPNIKNADNGSDANDKSGKNHINKARSLSRLKSEEHGGILRRCKSAIEESGKSIKRTGGSIKVAASVGAQSALSQMDGGDEVRNAASIGCMAARPATDAARMGANLYRRKVASDKSRIKKKDISRKIAKKAAKESSRKATEDIANASMKATAKKSAKNAAKATAAATGTAAGSATGTLAPVIGMVAGKAAGARIDRRFDKTAGKSRKLRFFMDKMKAQEEQQDSLLKLARDLLMNKASILARKVAVFIGEALLSVAGIIALIVIPVIAVLAILYNSPFAVFLPALEGGDTVSSVASAYYAEFNSEINALANEHAGCDTGRMVYVDYVRKADMFHKQTIKAKVAVERVETAVEALNVLINEFSSVVK